MAIAIKIVEPKKLTRLLSGVVFFLVLANIVGQYSKYYWGHGSLFGFVQLFYGESHGNIPHWFKAMCMLMISVILFFIYKIQKHEKAHFQRRWLLLSLIFLLMNIVQSANIHNILSVPIRKMLDVGGWLYFAWVIPAIVFVIFLVILYLHFYINLPPRTRRLVSFAGLMYVIGAISFEMATAYYLTSYGSDNFSFSVLSAFHETLKMAGLVLFIHAIMDYWSLKKQQFHLHFSNDAEANVS
jgi:hypothetical protein